MLWLDASRVAAAPVASLIDYSGSGNDFVQAVPANQPTRNAVGTIGTKGLTTVSFDGVNDYMTCDAPKPLAAALAGLNKPFSWFQVIKFPTPPTTEICLAFDKPVGPGRFAWYAPAANLAVYVETDAAAVTTNQLQLLNTYFLMGVFFNGTHFQAYNRADRVPVVAGVFDLAFAAAGATTGLTLVTKGATRQLGALANYSQFEFGEELVYPSVLSFEDRLRTFRYLSAKWGV